MHGSSMSLAGVLDNETFLQPLLLFFVFKCLFYVYVYLYKLLYTTCMSDAYRSKEGVRSPKNVVAIYKPA